MIALSHVLVATDFGEAADTALIYGRALATGFGMMGSVAERVVRTASCPVLTVYHPQHEFVTLDTLTSVAHV
jgi:hypothetical protein